MRVCVYIYEHHYKLFSILTRLRASRYNNSPTNMYIHIYRYICILVYLCVCFIHDSESLKIDRVLWCSLLGLHSHDWFPAAIHGMAPSYVLYIYRHTLYTLYISYMYIQTAKCLPVTLSVWISCTHIFFGKQ